MSRGKEQSTSKKIKVKKKYLNPIVEQLRGRQEIHVVLDTKT